MAHSVTPASIAVVLTATRHARTSDRAQWFVALVLGIAGAAALLAGWLPLTLSIVSVFLFAGPHNWLEARYFLARMPPRWGRLATYFYVAIAGVLILSLLFFALPLLMQGSVGVDATTTVAIWNSLLIVWLSVLVSMRDRKESQHPAWDFAVPIALLLLAFNWAMPFAWSLCLVYLHPLIALAFLDREIGRQSPEWRAIYRRCLIAVPLLLAVLWLKLGHAPDLAGSDLLTQQITRHAGRGVIAGVSTHFLVAAHTFLELLHYAVWVFAIPLLVRRARPWNFSDIPLMRRSAFWKWSIVIIIAVGALVVISLWGAFLIDHPITRDVYFTVALVHVLAEFPFLIRFL